MDLTALFLDFHSRPHEAFAAAIDGLAAGQLNHQPTPTTNSITWLAWHAAREEDAQLAVLAGTEEVWHTGGWQQRFGLDLPADAMGYGHSPEEVAKVTVTDPGLLTGYLEATAAATRDYIAKLGADDWDAVIDTNWDPPVTRGVRLVSIVDDAAQHAGQAAYLRGLLG
ncbi:mycothiol transferase [Parenemella sanctibonifatiensis]|uniref:DUF664 domain-containing protein n=1 Tax=Parenemella sanctibonifatiensis TaxID=2016505 RepID=A0A255EEN2_9ACTN|nr:DUF664 domain-containing protein [Parenemella sanctibonifatiensis]OYN89391.1 hypothetical protein CGZ91_10860 [Parenemella sanctibonifatiensis]